MLIVIYRRFLNLPNLHRNYLERAMLFAASTDVCYLDFENVRVYHLLLCFWLQDKFLYIKWSEKMRQRNCDFSMQSELKENTSTHTPSICFMCYFYIIIKIRTAMTIHKLLHSYCFSLPRNTRHCLNEECTCVSNVLACM